MIYDCEIIKGILARGETAVPGIEYCAGWDDHANMGISVICAYDYVDGRYRVFCEDGFSDFVDLARVRSPVIGFNSLRFDDKLCVANELDVATEYDLLVEVWRAAGRFSPSGLDALAKANSVGAKTGHGALAPVLWQQGQYGKVIDYCLDDIRLTKGLVDRVLRLGKLRDPRKPEHELKLRRPRADWDVPDAGEVDRSAVA